MLRVGRIPYINCYPVYGAIDAGVVKLDAELVTGVPSDLNAKMARGQLDVSVVSAIEYARASERYVLLPDLAISCDGPVRSVLLLSKVPAPELGGKRVMLSRSSMTSVALLELLFANVWHARPEFVPGDAELTDVARFPHTAPVVGAVEFRRKRKSEPMTLAILQGLVPNQGDAWQYTLDTLSSFASLELLSKDPHISAPNHQHLRQALREQFRATIELAQVG